MLFLFGWWVFLWVVLRHGHAYRPNEKDEVNVPLTLSVLRDKIPPQARPVRFTSTPVSNLTTDTVLLVLVVVLVVVVMVVVLLLFVVVLFGCCCCDTVSQTAPGKAEQGHMHAWSVESLFRQYFVRGGGVVV